MKAIKNTSSNFTEPINIHYINSVGAIIDNSLMLHIHSKSLIDIRDIRKAEIYKIRRFVYNSFFIFCSLSLFSTLLIYDFTMLEKLLVSILIVLSLGFAFFFKNSKYILHIRKFDVDFIELEVNRSCKEDAKNIVRLVNRRIKELSIK